MYELDVVLCMVIPPRIKFDTPYSINQSNFNSTNIPGKAMLSGAIFTPLMILLKMAVKVKSATAGQMQQWTIDLPGHPCLHAFNKSTKTSYCGNKTYCIHHL